MKHFILFCSVLLALNSSSNSKTILVPSEQPTIQSGIDVSENGDIVL
jgi:hypothetical protein